VTTYERFTADHPNGRTLQPVKGTDAGDVVTDTVGGLDIVAFCVDDAIHAFENVGYDFERVGSNNGADKRERFRADGTTWDGITGVSAHGGNSNGSPPAASTRSRGRATTGRTPSMSPEARRPRPDQDSSRATGTPASATSAANERESVSRVENVL